MPERVSHLWIDLPVGDSFYATEKCEADEVVSTDAGTVPRRYFVSDKNLQAIVDCFLERGTMKEDVEWVDADELVQFWS